MSKKTMHSDLSEHLPKGGAEFGRDDKMRPEQKENIFFFSVIAFIICGVGYCIYKLWMFF